MAKKEKEGNGNHATEEKPEQKSGTQMAQRPQSSTTAETAHPLRRLREEMDMVFDRFFGRWPMDWDWAGFPQRLAGSDVEETDKEIVVRAEVPGFESKDFDVHVSDNTLTIQAEHHEEGNDDEGGSHRWHRRFGRYQRSIPLSGGVEADKVKASYRNGVLEVHMPRTESSPRRRIEVGA